jgi:stage II sporulation protein AA (anti-sigma F factor antagonist)
MNVKLVPHDRAPVLEVGGVLDTPAARDFEKEINAALGASGRFIVVDLSTAELLTSACIRVLVTTHKRLKAAGGALWLAALNAHVIEVFTVAGIAGHFLTAATQAEALSKCQPSGQAAPPPPPARMSELARRSNAALGQAMPGVRVPPLASSGTTSALTDSVRRALSR